MKMSVCTFILLSAVPGFASGQTSRNEPKNKLIVHADAGKTTISRHIYGQFSEHLGRGIYEAFGLEKTRPFPTPEAFGTMWSPR